MKRKAKMWSWKHMKESRYGGVMRGNERLYISYTSGVYGLDLPKTL